MRLSSTLILLLCSLCSTLGCGEDDGPTRPPAPEAPTNTIFVDTAAPPEGTGAESAPLRTISEALSVEGVTKIVVATGTYEVPAQHSFATALSIESLAGKSETFFINRMASAPLSWNSSESLTVSGVTFFIGLNLSGESFTFNDIAIDTGGAALEASWSELPWGASAGGEACCFASRAARRLEPAPGIAAR